MLKVKNVCKLTFLIGENKKKIALVSLKIKMSAEPFIHLLDFGVL